MVMIKKMEKNGKVEAVEHVAKNLSAIHFGTIMLTMNVPLFSIKMVQNVFWIMNAWQKHSPEIQFFLSHSMPNPG